MLIFEYAPPPPPTPTKGSELRLPLQPPPPPPITSIVLFEEFQSLGTLHGDVLAVVRNTTVTAYPANKKLQLLQEKWRIDREKLDILAMGNDKPSRLTGSWYDNLSDSSLNYIIEHRRLRIRNGELHNLERRDVCAKLGIKRIDNVCIGNKSLLRRNVGCRQYHCAGRGGV